MSRFAKINLLEVEDSVAGRVEGLEGRFGRQYLGSPASDSRRFGMRGTTTLLPDAMGPLRSCSGLAAATHWQTSDGLAPLAGGTMSMPLGPILSRRLWPKLCPARA